MMQLNDNDGCIIMNKINMAIIEYIYFYIVHPKTRLKNFVMTHFNKRTMSIH